MDVLRRLRAMSHSRGASGVLRFVASRLLWHRRDLIFEARTADHSVESAGHESGTVLFIDSHNVDRDLPAVARCQLFDGEGRDYLLGIRNGDVLLVVLDATGRVQHHSYVLFDTRTKCVLGEPREVPLFANCVTVAEARGRHLYPRTLRDGLAWLNAHGHPRAVINCDPDNRASIHGIRHAGFVPLADASTWIVLGCIGLQRRRDASGRVSYRFYAG